MYPVSVSEVGVTTSHNYCSQILAPAWCGAILHSAVFVMVVRFSHISSLSHLLLCATVLAIFHHNFDSS